MKSHAKPLNMIRAAGLIGVLVCLLAAGAGPAAVLTPDVVTVATVNGAQFTVVDVPVSIRDVSGTPLGLDQPPGSRIQSYSIKVNYAPAAAVQSITFTRAGITSSLTPTFEASPSSAGSISLLDTFQESTNLIPFTLNGLPPGNKVAHLLVTLSPTATVGQVITLTLDPTLTQLTDEAGDPGTIETTANTRLALVSGSITVVPSIPAMSYLVLGLLAVALAFAGIKLVPVTYRGGASATNDLLAGHVKIGSLGSTPLIPHYKAGAIRLLAQSMAVRSSSLPEVPTFQEAGIKGLVLDQWLGLFAPTGTPSAITTRLNAEIDKALTDTAVREAHHRQAQEVVGGTAGHFLRVFQEDYLKYERLVKELNIKVQ